MTFWFEPIRAETIFEIALFFFHMTAGQFFPNLAIFCMKEHEFEYNY